MPDKIDLEIEACQQEIEKLIPQLSNPEMLSESHRGETWLKGNRSAFLHLAVFALRAAQKQHDNLASLTWFRNKAWQLTSFYFDEAPFATDDVRRKFDHSYRPVWLYAISVALVIFVCVGAWTVARWIYLWATVPGR